MSEHASFLRAFFKDFTHVGAIAPSSKQLAGLMLDWMDWSQINHIVEFGPGTGVFTQAIHQRINEDTHFFAVERDPDLAKHTRQRCPEVEVVESCVSRLPELCLERSLERIDAIVCGLPWAAFTTEMQNQCLSAVLDALPEGGYFATFAYWQGLALPAGIRFKRTLHESFSSVENSGTAWRNLPPAFVYQCRK
ncbi:MAG: methyltransferase domain-containing protein [Verrucomicrobiota bacterium]